jgi:hypothetical protein
VDTTLDDAPNVRASLPMLKPVFDPCAGVQPSPLRQKTMTPPEAPCLASKRRSALFPPATYVRSGIGSSDFSFRSLISCISAQSTVDLESTCRPPDSEQIESTAPTIHNPALPSGRTPISVELTSDNSI